MKTLHATTCAALAAWTGATATAQTYTAHLIDNPASSTGQNIPIAGGSTSFDEARSHIFFPAAYLPPGAGLITGVQVVPSTTNTTPYERFEISMGLTPNPGLSTTFAANTPGPMQLMYSQSPGAISWTGGTWNTIPFTGLFVYDGVSNLVMEIVKVLDRPNNPTIPSVSHRALVYPRRADLPVPVWSTGIYGSGAANAATANLTYNTQLLIRLEWLATPALTINSTRDTSTTTNRSYFHIGSTITLNTQGSPGEFFANGLGFGLFPFGIPISGMFGALWLSTVEVLGFGQLDVNGQGGWTLPIPVDPAFVGVHIYFQSATLGSVIVLTNVADGIIAS